MCPEKKKSDLAKKKTLLCFSVILSVYEKYSSAPARNSSVVYCSLVNKRIIFNERTEYRTEVHYLSCFSGLSK